MKTLNCLLLLYLVITTTTTTTTTALTARPPCGPTCGCVVTPCPTYVIVNPCVPNPW